MKLNKESRPAPSDLGGFTDYIFFVEKEDEYEVISELVHKDPCEEVESLYN